VWPAQRPVVGVEAGRRPVGRPARSPLAHQFCSAGNSARARSRQRDEQAPRADCVRGKRTSGRIPSARLLRNDLGTLVGRYRRFCIVAHAPASLRLPVAVREPNRPAGRQPIATLRVSLRREAATCANWRTPGEVGRTARPFAGRLAMHRRVCTPSCPPWYRREARLRLGRPRDRFRVLTRGRAGERVATEGTAARRRPPSSARDDCGPDPAGVRRDLCSFVLNWSGRLCL
jgi:hypothetical protein